MIKWDSSENHILLNPRLPESEKRRLLGLVDQVSTQFRAHIFILSSGTTHKSEQKLRWVALSKEAFLCSAQSVNQHLSVLSQDHWLQLLPTYHVGGLAIWARSFLSGARVSTLPSWSVDSFLSCVEDHSVTHVSLVPAQVFDLVQAQRRCPQSMKFVLVGAGALSSELFVQAQKLGWPLLSTYGMTEMCSSIAITDPQLMNQDSYHQLKVLPHVRLRCSSEGVLEIQSLALLSGYVDENDSGQAEWRSPLSEGGWFQTSDRGVIEQGFLRILGRGSDFIKIGGESVELNRLSAHLERVKIQLKLSADLALIAYPDERLGHVIHLVSDQRLSSDEFNRLSEEYHSSVLPFEKIRQWHILPQIPRTELKKLKLADCLEMVKQVYSARALSDR